MMMFTTCTSLAIHAYMSFMSSVLDGIGVAEKNETRSVSKMRSRRCCSRDFKLPLFVCKSTFGPIASGDNNAKSKMSNDDCF